MGEGGRLDAVKFGWKSNDSVSGHRGIVEVQRFRTAVKGSTGNVWGEIAAATQGKYLYQDIDTANTSDAMYTVRLERANRNEDAGTASVLVGAPGREKPVTMRRTIANAGDKAGEESTTITSTGTGQDDQWDTYEGTVLVPGDRMSHGSRSKAWPIRTVPAVPTARKAT